MKNRILMSACLLSIAASAFTLTRRVRLESDRANDLAGLANGILMGVPFYLAVVLIVVNQYPDSRVSVFLNRVCELLVVPVFSVVLVGAWVPYLLGLAYTTGSWPSMSMLAAGILVVFTSVRNRMPGFHAFVLAVAVMGVWTGIWEIPYQTMLRIVYEVPQIGSEAFVRIGWEWAIEILTAGYGLYVLVWLGRKYGVARVGKAFWVFMALCAGAFVYWVVTGYWCDDYYDWSLKEWVQTPGFDIVALFMAKVSKTFFMLALLSLVWSKKRSEIEGMSDQD